MKYQWLLTIVLCANAFARSEGTFIVVDQFGYPPDARKVAVIKDPHVGFDADISYLPGNDYALIDVTSENPVYAGTPSPWNNGQIDPSSGDRVWHFDFSEVSTPGTYYVLDTKTGQRSYPFEIAANVYRDVLKHAVRTFFYQRAGCAKPACYAGQSWADGASHAGPLQDPNCRAFFDPDNPATERDVRGGWYDAGDYNKYTNWTANYIVDFMLAYLENPDVWTDDYNIPESGNGIPDLLDEAKWGLDHLLRLQQSDGSMISIVAEAHASPPSAAIGPSFYGRVNTSSTLNACAAFALGSKVYRLAGLTDYADTLLIRAVRAWDWAEANPRVLFNNNDPAYGSSGLGAGRQELDDYGRIMARLEAAVYLYDVTGERQYRVYFDTHYRQCHLMQWTYAYPFETTHQEIVLYYTTLDNGTTSVKDRIKTTYKKAMRSGADNFPAMQSQEDPYFAYLKDYTWGSNATKACQGLMYYDVITYGIDDALDVQAMDAALVYVNYLHGVNPLSFVYLSNMVAYGADNGVNEFYHSWFCNGSPRWDRVGVSTYGPAPGFLTGGPNPSYDWDNCCPNGCGSAYNNGLCLSESISPPRNQPDQKSYKDFNTSWPLNSWSVTENSCGYQIKYIRLLSKFVTASDLR